MLILRKIDVMGVEFVQFDQLIVPDEYRCPISKEIVKDPVISSTGRFDSYLDFSLNFMGFCLTFLGFD
jgi:hypothetical protein